MLRKLIIAGATLATLSGPALAANWYIVRPLAGGHQQTSQIGGTTCQVVDRQGAAGEEQIAGPFQSHSVGMASVDNYAACMQPLPHGS